MSKSILVTGATGKQGSSVISHLLSNPEYTILAVTRDITSPSVQALLAKTPSIKLVQGDLNQPSELFSAAKKASPDGSIWGVFSVQTIVLKEKKSTKIEDSLEVKQGTSLIDEAIKNDIKHFVYSSVDRGGEEVSWENETNVPHFKTKHFIEQHLVKSTKNSSMTWTILRPVIFMENLLNDFPTKIFLTALKDTMGPTKSMPWISTFDIGYFASESFNNPTSSVYHKRALTIASDELTFEQLNQIFIDQTGKPIKTTVGILGKALKSGVKEVGLMINWFRDQGYNADLIEMKRLNPNMVSFEDWLKTRSDFVVKR